MCVICWGGGMREYVDRRVAIERGILGGCGLYQGTFLEGFDGCWVCWLVSAVVDGCGCGFSAIVGWIG